MMDFKSSLQIVINGIPKMEGLPACLDLGLVPQIADSVLQASWQKATNDLKDNEARYGSYTEQTQLESIRQSSLKSTHREMERRIKLVYSYLHCRGTRYQDCTFENYQATTPEQRKVLSQIRGISNSLDDATELQKNLFLYGKCGTGKDHLLTALITKTIWLHGHDVEWINGNRYFSRMKDAVGKSSMDEWTRPLIASPVLAISDPLPVRGVLSDFIASQLSDVIDYRYNEMLPTWITVNVANRKEADERIGIRTVDRLIDGGNFIRCKWDSFRAKG